MIAGRMLRDVSNYFGGVLRAGYYVLSPGLSISFICLRMVRISSHVISLKVKPPTPSEKTLLQTRELGH